jgi:uncharacterized protein YjiS (DUF1127 family)
MTTNISNLSAIDTSVKFPRANVDLLKLIKQWHSRASQRRHLSELTSDQLHDVGISAEAARGEVAKRFWQV